MISELAGAFQGTKAALGAVKAALDLKSETEKNAAIIDVQRSIIEVQLQLSEVQSRYDELASAKRETETKLAAFEKWEIEAARYKLVEIIDGVFAYSLAVNNDEPNPWLCSACFGGRAKSILQRKASSSYFFCPICKMEIRTDKPRPPSAFALGGSY